MAWQLAVVSLCSCCYRCCVLLLLVMCVVVAACVGVLLVVDNVVAGRGARCQRSKPPVAYVRIERPSGQKQNKSCFACGCYCEERSQRLSAPCMGRRSARGNLNIAWIKKGRPRPLWQEVPGWWLCDSLPEKNEYHSRPAEHAVDPEGHSAGRLPLLMGVDDPDGGPGVDAFEWLLREEADDSHAWFG